MRYCYLLVLLFSLGCGPTYIFDEEIKIAEGGWSYEQPVRFEFNAPDTTNSYTLWLTVNHASDYAYENIYLNIKTEFPAQQATDQRLSLDIANKFGRWEGECNSERCLTLIPLQTKVRFRELGEHALIFTQDSREEQLLGVNALSLSVEKIRL